VRMVKEVFVGTPSMKRPLWRQEIHRVCNIKTDIMELGCEGVNWTGVTIGSSGWFMYGCENLPVCTKTKHFFRFKYLLYSYSRYCTKQIRSPLTSHPTYTMHNEQYTAFPIFTLRCFQQHMRYGNKLSENIIVFPTSFLIHNYVYSHYPCFL
jgi:hypothetical protein